MGEAQTAADADRASGDDVRWVGGIATGGRKVVIGLASVQVLVSIANAVDWMAGRPSWRISSLVDLERESSIGTWLHTVALLGGAVTLAVVTAATVRADRRAWPLLLIPLALLGLSVDEVVQMHEWLGRSIEGATVGEGNSGALSDTGPWVVLAVPFAIGLALVLRRAQPYLRSAPTAHRLLIGGFVVYLAGAAGMELLRNVVDEGGAAHLAQVIVEEGLEGLGAIGVLWAGLMLLDRASLRIAIGSLPRTT
ncbi:MAG: hypothetical protein S0880_16550 [Actinomycetota bacterium]|nr:hypothetical protein [Actinomycetota bacterium]